MPASIYIGWRHPSVWACVCICACVRCVTVVCACVGGAFCARVLRCCCGVLIYVCVCLRVCCLLYVVIRARVQGKQTFPNGMVYVGEFKDDKKNGQVRRVDALPLSAPHGALRARFCSFSFCCSMQYATAACAGSNVAAVAVRGYTIRALWIRLHILVFFFRFLCSVFLFYTQAPASWQIRVLFLLNAHAHAV